MNPYLTVRMHVWNSNEFVSLPGKRTSLSKSSKNIFKISKKKFRPKSKFLYYILYYSLYNLYSLDFNSALSAVHGDYSFQWHSWSWPPVIFHKLSQIPVIFHEIPRPPVTFQKFSRPQFMGITNAWFLNAWFLDACILDASFLNA